MAEIIYAKLVLTAIMEMSSCTNSPIRDIESSPALPEGLRKDTSRVLLILFTLSVRSLSFPPRSHY